MTDHRRTTQTDFEAFEGGSSRRRRLLREEQLIVQVAEKLVEMLEREDVSRSELSHRLGKSKGFISQILAGDKNLTLRTVADVCDALGYRAQFDAARSFVVQPNLSQRVLILAVPRLKEPVMQLVPPQVGAETAA